MAEFFDMGGYAAYVWPSFAISAAVLIAIAVQSYKALKSAEKELQMMQVAEASVTQPQEQARDATPPLEGKPHEA